jgi:hypothetical protein
MDSKQVVHRPGGTGNPDRSNIMNQYEARNLSEDFWCAIDDQFFSIYEYTPPAWRDAVSMLCAY